MQAFIMLGYSFDSKSLTPEQWQSRYDSLIGSNTLPLLCVGADETQLNITWHADRDNAYPEVMLSKNADMSGAVIFVMTLASAVTWLIYHKLLLPLKLAFADRIRHAQFLNDASEILLEGDALKLPTVAPSVIIPVVELFLK